MKILRILVLFLINITGYQNINACGGWEEYDSYFRLFSPGYMLPDNEFGPITYSDEPWSNIENWFSFEAQHDNNIDSWKSYFNVSFSKKSIKEFIYDFEADYLDRVKKSQEEATNDVLKWAVKNDKKLIDYIIFAKKCEAFCNPPQYYYWEKKEEKDVNGMNELIQNGESLYSSSSLNPFLKERYAFQLVKLMRHAGAYDKCLSFGEKVLKSFSKKSMIYYWTLDHIAGVQLKKGYQTEALLKFIEVFQNCPSKRYSSYYSIDINTDEEWSDLYDACQTNQQKETMFFIRASHLGSIALSDIRSIYEINPNSVYLPALINREINKIESILLQNSKEENVYYQQYYNNKNINSELTQYVDEFNLFLNKAIIEAKISDKDFWSISAAYTSFLINKPEDAEKLLSGVSDNISEGFSEQINIIKNVLLITDKNQTTTNRQNKLKEIWDLEVEDFAFFFFQHASNNLPFPLATGDSNYDLRVNPETDKLEALVSLTSNYQELTWYANHILENHYLRTSNQLNQSFNLDYLNEMLGTSYLAADRTVNAIEAFSRLSDGFKENNESFNLDYNPFNYLVNDNQWESQKQTRYNKLKFANTLHTIEQKIKADEASAIDYYLLGNAYYNTTYFGYAWDVKAYYWSGSYYTGVYDCSKAHKYYLTAAEKTEDREMQAKCYFLAAKANQNLYLTKKSNSEYLWISDFNEEELRNNGFRSEFEKLQESYNDTKFYSLIIDECKYFSYYVN